MLLIRNMDVINQSIHGSLVISCDPNINCKSFIEKIVNTNDLLCLELSFGSNQTVKCYEWNIDNKYYSTKIHFFDTQTKSLVSLEFCNSVHAVIIYFDGSDESSFACVKSWMPFFNEFELEIRLLVCDTINDTTAVTRLCAQQWCIANQFELIELNECVAEDSDYSDSDICGMNVNGVCRVLQALQAYMWPNSVLKNCHQYTPSKKFKHLINNDIIDSIRCDTENSEKNDDQLSASDLSLLQPNSSDECEDNIDSFNLDEMDSFEDLFTKFNDMKIRASLLNDSERRIYAEKVALAFWKSIGGDNDSDCDDNQLQD